MLALSEQLSVVAERLQAYAAAPAAHPAWIGLTGSDRAEVCYDLYPWCAQLGRVLWLRCGARTWPASPLHAQCMLAVAPSAPAAQAAELVWSPCLAVHAVTGAAMDALVTMLGQLQTYLLGADHAGRPAFLLLDNIDDATATDQRFLQLLLRTPWMRQVAVVAIGRTLPAGFLPLDLTLEVEPPGAAPRPETVSETAASLLVALRLYGDGMPAAYMQRLFLGGGALPIGLVEYAGRLYFANAVWRRAAAALTRSNPARARQLAGQLAGLAAEQVGEEDHYRLAWLRARARDMEGLASALHALYAATPPFDRPAAAPLWLRLRRLAHQRGDQATWALATSNLAFSQPSQRRLAEVDRLATAAAARLTQPDWRCSIHFEVAQILTRSRDTTVFPAAQTHYDAAMAAAGDIVDPAVQASRRSAVMNGLALLSLHSGRPDEALGRELRAIQFLERLPVKVRRCSEIQDQLLNNSLRMGDVYRKRLKDYWAASFWYRRALRHARAGGQKWSEFFAYKSLGLAGAEAGLYSQALHNFIMARRALTESKSYGTSNSSLQLELHQVHWWSADMLFNLGRFDAARREFESLLHGGLPLTPKATELLRERVQLCRQNSAGESYRSKGEDSTCA